MFKLLAWHCTALTSPSGGGSIEEEGATLTESRAYVAVTRSCPSLHRCHRLVETLGHSSLFSCERADVPILVTLSSTLAETVGLKDFGGNVL